MARPQWSEDEKAMLNRLKPGDMVYFAYPDGTFRKALVKQDVGGRELEFHVLAANNYLRSLPGDVPILWMNEEATDITHLGAKDAQ